MRIRVRIAMGFAAVIALTVAVGAVGAWNLERYATGVHRADAASRVAMGFGEVKRAEAGMLAGDPGAETTEREVIARLTDRAGETSGAEETRAALAGHQEAFLAKSASRRELTVVSNAITGTIDQLDKRVTQITTAQVRRTRQAASERDEATANASGARAAQTGSAAIRFIVMKARTLQAGGDFKSARDALYEVDRHIEALPEFGRLVVTEAVSRYRDRLSWGAKSGLDLGLESQAAMDAAMSIGVASEEAERRARETADEAEAAYREATALTDRGRQLRLASYEIRLLVTRILSGEIPPEDEIGGVTARIEMHATAIGEATGDDEVKALISSLKTIDRDIVRLGRVVDADKAASKAMLDASTALTQAASTAAEAELRVAGEGKERASLVSLVAMLAAAFAALILAFLIGRSVARGIAALTARMRALAEGGIDGAIPFHGKAGELGLMAASVAVFQEGERKRLALETEMAGARERAERERRETLDGLAAEWEGRLSDVVAAVNAAAGRLADGARGIAGLARETGARAGEVARDTGQASRGVQSLASAAEELAASITEISRTVGQASDEVRSGEEGASRAQSDVSSLSTAAEGVGAIVNLIAEIAGQTNLLALNATIEAARAGDAGKGFAVVAGEVKALAAQTAHAASEIAQRITSIRDETARTVQTIDTVRAVMERIGRATTSVAAAVEQQREATAEIARTAQTVADNAEAANRAIGTVEGAATRVGENAVDIHNASEALTATGGDLARTSDSLFRAMRAV